VFLADYITGAWGPLVRPVEVEWTVVVGLILLAIVMAWMYPKGYEGRTPWLEGLRFGVLVGLMVEAYGALFAYHFLSVSGTGIAGQAAIFILRDALAGAVIGTAYGRVARGARTATNA
jgi:hypothetical protein